MVCKLLLEFWGFFCFVYIFDGLFCGLLNYFVYKCKIIMKVVDVLVVFGVLLEFGVNNYFLVVIIESVVVMFDGKVVGWCVL